jgi:hypothetical protein
MDAQLLKLERVNRKGLFYILRSGQNYKFGATTRDVNQRRRSAKDIKGLDYEIIYTKLCKDVFGFEKLFKWALANYQRDFTFETYQEFFYCDDITPKLLIDIAEGLK